jgi:hypothetical protein
MTAGIWDSQLMPENLQPECGECGGISMHREKDGGGYHDRPPAAAATVNAAAARSTPVDGDTSGCDIPGCEATTSGNL